MIILLPLKSMATRLRKITAIILSISIGGLVAYYESVSRTKIKVTSNINWESSIGMQDIFAKGTKFIVDVRNGIHTYTIQTKLMSIELRRQGWLAHPPISGIIFDWRH
ncbi:MAG: hypothetical protein ACFFDN_30660 [Candidatus Hodarchaeota archaeon]